MIDERKRLAIGSVHAFEPQNVPVASGGVTGTEAVVLRDGERLIRVIMPLGASGRVWLRRLHADPRGPWSVRWNAAGIAIAVEPLD